MSSIRTPIFLNLSNAGFTYLEIVCNSSAVIFQHVPTGTSALEGLELLD